MPWIPVWFERDQWFDLTASFRSVGEIAELEQPQRAAAYDLLPSFSFDEFPLGQTSSVSRAVQEEDNLRTLFLRVSHDVFQGLIGTTLQLMEEVRNGNELQLRLPDGRIRRVILTVPEEEQRHRFQGGNSTGSGAV